jgi:hypothetical protein
VREWTIGILTGVLTALGAVALAMAKADLEDSTVCQWLARRLIYRAAQRLPREERSRWREEWIRHELDVPGRVLPLIRALDIYVRAGSWGRMLRGVPTRSEVLKARLRAAWQWLRSLPEAWARALVKQRHPAFQARAQVQAEAESAHVVTLAPAAVTQLQAIGTTRSSGSGSLGTAPLRLSVRTKRWPWEADGMPHLSDKEFLAWLSQQRQEFEDDVDRQVGEWRQRRGRLL